jgi:hypothetical protein
MRVTSLNQRLLPDAPALRQTIGHPRKPTLSRRPFHRFNRKNFWVPEIGLVTTFCPTTTGGGELVFRIRLTGYV